VDICRESFDGCLKISNVGKEAGVEEVDLLECLLAASVETDSLLLCLLAPGWWVVVVETVSLLFSLLETLAEMVSLLPCLLTYFAWSRESMASKPSG